MRRTFLIPALAAALAGAAVSLIRPSEPVQAAQLADAAKDARLAVASGEFSEAQCVYDTEVGFQILTETSNGPIRGEMRLEVPCLSNADMVQIVPDPDDRDVVEALIHQYPDDSGRIPDGRSVSVMSDHPVPPESCAEGACPCFPIGF